MKILLIDDDHDLIDLLRYAFQREGYSVSTASDGEAGLRAYKRELPDLVVLDWMLPAVNGIQVLQQLRQHSQVPVLMLTALNDEESIVHALQIGADDYLTKPFRPRELIARAHTLLRRSRSEISDQEKAAQLVSLGDVQLDPNAHQVRVAGRSVQLSRTEFLLLQYLMLNQGLVVGVRKIISNVWGYEGGENEEVVKVTISRLRRKLESDPSHPKYIINVPGAGYKFQCADA